MMVRFPFDVLPNPNMSLFDKQPPHVRAEYNEWGPLAGMDDELRSYNTYRAYGSAHPGSQVFLKWKRHQDEMERYSNALFFS